MSINRINPSLFRNYFRLLSHWLRFNPHNRRRLRQQAAAEAALRTEYHWPRVVAHPTGSHLSEQH
jgi:hypothetical protein